MGPIGISAPMNSIVPAPGPPPRTPPGTPPGIPPPTPRPGGCAPAVAAAAAIVVAITNVRIDLSICSSVVCRGRACSARQRRLRDQSIGATANESHGAGEPVVADDDV